MSHVSLDPYLTFDGRAHEAMEFYRSVLGGTLEVQTFGEFGAPVSDDYKDKVMHSRLEADDGLVLMASDDQEGSTPTVGTNVNLSLTGGPAEKDRLTAAFAALCEGGTTTMPLDEAPWNAYFGMLTDKYGINWLVNIDKGGAAPQ
jgi:PhnB protein